MFDLDPEVSLNMVVRRKIPEPDTNFITCIRPTDGCYIDRANVNLTTHPEPAEDMWVPRTLLNLAHLKTIFFKLFRPRRGLANIL
jgi:hypothetical protein